jgi:hypothetical protein
MLPLLLLLLCVVGALCAAPAAVTLQRVFPCIMLQASALQALCCSTLLLQMVLPFHCCSHCSASPKVIHRHNFAWFAATAARCAALPEARRRLSTRCCCLLVHALVRVFSLLVLLSELVTHCCRHITAWAHLRLLLALLLATIGVTAACAAVADPAKVPSNGCIRIMFTDSAYSIAPRVFGLGARLQEMGGRRENLLGTLSLGSELTT